MTFARGTRLGPYEIVDSLGAGGMGEVYKARDTRLDRVVALKVLSGHASYDADGRSRFDREARAISALDHPHICMLHDVRLEPPLPAADGPDTPSPPGSRPVEPIPFLVMEYVDGETLAARLRRGPIAPTRAVEIAIQIADALAAAHRSGIVHRDVKPGNIMLARGRAGDPDSGDAKLLDFGLARLKPSSRHAGDGPPSTIGPETTPGLLLGTMPYMAPEQLDGQEADLRSDIFAFGAVLYEMLTGQRAFPGTSEAGVIAAIMTGTPVPLRELQPLAAPRLERLVAKCLQKSPDARWQDAGDLADELRWLAEADAGVSTGAGSSRAGNPARMRRLITGVAIAVVVLSIGAAIFEWRRVAASRSWPPGSDAPNAALSLRLSLELPADKPLAPSGLVTPAHDAVAVALSRDGKQLAYVALIDGLTALCVRDMKTARVKVLEHTVGGHTPFFSPAGDWLGFFGDGALQKVRVEGGEPVTIAGAHSPRGASWGLDGRIYFVRSEMEGVFSVGADGTDLRPEFPKAVYAPECVDRQQRVLASSAGVVYYFRPGSGEPVKAVTPGTRALYARSGHLVYGSSHPGRLMAVPFDVERGTTRGAPVQLADDIRTAPYAVAQFALTDEGTLVYAPGRPQQRAAFAWVDGDGKRTPLGLPEADYEAFALSPDGRMLAYGIDGVIYVHEISTATTTRLTPRETVGDRPRRIYPRWTPDSRTVLYIARPRDAPNRLMAADVDGGAEAAVLWTAGGEGPEFLYPMGFSPDGNVLLAFGPTRGSKASDLYRALLKRSGGSLVLGPPEPLRSTEFGEVFGQVSRDGRWLLYNSDESGQMEVYVTSYHARGKTLRISADGGQEPVWSPDGRAIYFLRGLSMYKVDVLPDAEFRAGEPRLLFTGAFPDSLGFGYDIARDGKRFLMLVNDDILKPTPRLTVITNIFDELRRIAPAAGPHQLTGAAGTLGPLLGFLPQGNSGGRERRP